MKRLLILMLILISCHGQVKTSKAVYCNSANITADIEVSAKDLARVCECVEDIRKEFKSDKEITIHFLNNSFPRWDVDAYAKKSTNEIFIRIYKPLIGLPSIINNYSSFKMRRILIHEVLHLFSDMTENEVIRYTDIYDCE